MDRLVVIFKCLLIIIYEVVSNYLFREFPSIVILVM